MTLSTITTQCLLLLSATLLFGTPAAQATRSTTHTEPADALQALLETTGHLLHFQFDTFTAFSSLENDNDAASLSSSSSDTTIESAAYLNRGADSPDGSPSTPDLDPSNRHGDYHETNVLSRSQSPDADAADLRRVRDTNSRSPVSHSDRVIDHRRRSPSRSDRRRSRPEEPQAAPDTIAGLLSGIYRGEERHSHGEVSLRHAKKSIWNDRIITSRACHILLDDPTPVYPRDAIKPICNYAQSLGSDFPSPVDGTAERLYRILMERIANHGSHGSGPGAQVEALQTYTLLLQIVRLNPAGKKVHLADFSKAVHSAAAHVYRTLNPGLKTKKLSSKHIRLLSKNLVRYSAAAGIGKPMTVDLNSMPGVVEACRTAVHPLAYDHVKNIFRSEVIFALCDHFFFRAPHTSIIEYTLDGADTPLNADDSAAAFYTAERAVILVAAISSLTHRVPSISQRDGLLDRTRAVSSALLAHLFRTKLYFQPGDSSYTVRLAKFTVGIKAIENRDAAVKRTGPYPSTTSLPNHREITEEVKKSLKSFVDNPLDAARTKPAFHKAIYEVLSLFPKSTDINVLAFSSLAEYMCEEHDIEYSSPSPSSSSSSGGSPRSSMSEGSGSSSPAGSRSRPRSNSRSFSLMRD